MFRSLACLLAAAALAAGCTLLEKERIPLPNRPPEAFLTGGPVDGDPDTFYRVHFYWSGDDPDGRVVRYETLLTNDEVTGSLIIDEGLYARLELLGYTWTSTTAFQGQFVVSADQFPDLSEPADSIYWEPDPLRFHAQHTLFVRAVDDDGAVSTLPAHRSFTATTLAPEVRITHPVVIAPPGGWNDVATAVRYRWTGWDSLQNGSVIDPDSSRFALLEVEDLQADPDSGLLFSLPDSAWSPWRGWKVEDPGGGAGGQQVLLEDLTPHTVDLTGYYRFFVQAKDEAGAVTSHFQDGVNLRRMRVVTSLQPQLRLASAAFGLRILDHDATLDLEAPADLPLGLSWSGSAENYGSEIGAYRFGWDIQDPEDDGEWSDWSPTATSSQVSYSAGEHELRVQCRDLSGNTTAATLVFSFVPITLERDLILVDDYDNSASEDPLQGWPLGEAHTWGTFTHSDAEMETWWNALLSDYSGYLPARDFLRLSVAVPAPSLALLGLYARVIWEVKESSPVESGLARLAGFVDPYAVGLPPQDLLSPWLEAGGRLLLCGSRPLHSLLPLAAAMGDDGYERRQPLAFLRDLGWDQGSASESQAAVQRFLPWRWFGVDASALPVNSDPRRLPGSGDDWPTDRSYWGMVGAGLDGGSLAVFGNAGGWSPPDTLRFRPEVYDWFEDAWPVFAPTAGRFGLADAEIYNWDWMAGAYDPPLNYRADQFLPLLSYLPADSTTRWGMAPADEHEAVTTGGAPYCESCYSSGVPAAHAVAVVGLGAPMSPSVLLGLAPYYLSDADARSLIGHVFRDIMTLEP